MVVTNASHMHDCAKLLGTLMCTVTVLLYYAHMAVCGIVKNVHTKQLEI